MLLNLGDWKLTLDTRKVVEVLETPGKRVRGKDGRAQEGPKELWAIAGLVGLDTHCVGKTQLTEEARQAVQERGIALIPEFS